MKLGMHEELKVTCKWYCFLADPGRAKISHGGSLPPETSSSDWKSTATDRIHSNDQEAFGMKCCYFWFHCEVKFLTRF